MAGKETTKTPSTETRGNIQVGKPYEIKDQKAKRELFEQYKKYANFMKPEELEGLRLDELRITVTVDLWQRDSSRRFIGNEEEQLSCAVKVFGSSQKYPQSTCMTVQYSYKDFAALVGVKS